MRIDSLAVTNFRNIQKALIRPGPGVNIFYGDNGAGKTNLLEAIFTLCLGRSQRGARDLMLVHENGDDVFRLEGTGEVDGHGVKITCAYQKGGRKKITIDDNPVRLSKLFQLFSVISMAPDDTALLAGAPLIRRRFMDLHLSQASPSYLADLTDYNKALAQKNSFLKYNPSGEECPFDPLLVEYGSRIIAMRHRFVHFLRAMAPGYYRQIAGVEGEVGRGNFMIEYAPSVTFVDKADIAESFREKLAVYRRKEMIVESALVGPHRDEIAFGIGGFAARGYGSQGELRSGAIAIMLAAANFLESRRREKPILLLDEIFAELDPARRDNLAAMFSGFEQIFLTTAVKPPAALHHNGAVFHIAEGEVRSG